MLQVHDGFLIFFKSKDFSYPMNLGGAKEPRDDVCSYEMRSDSEPQNPHNHRVVRNMAH